MSKYKFIDLVCLSPGITSADCTLDSLTAQAASLRDHKKACFSHFATDRDK
jgi:hypothetical protein